MVGQHRARRGGIAEAEEFRAGVGERTRSSGEIIEDLDQRLLFDPAEHRGSRAGKEEAVVDGGVGQPDAVHVGPVMRAPVIGDGIDGGIEGGEAVPDREERVLVADVQVGVGILRERNRRSERDFGVDRGIETRGADGRPAEGQRGVLPWFEDFGPVVGPANHELVAVGSRRVAGGHGAGADARGFRSGHGRRGVRVDENREAQRIAAPADAVVEDGEDLRGLARAGEGRALRDKFWRGFAASINFIRVLPHGV